MSDLTAGCAHCQEELRNALTSCSHAICNDRSDYLHGQHLINDIRNAVNSDAFGEAPLIVAVKRGLNGVARELLKTGSDVNRTNEDGRSALHYAAKNGNIGAMSLLIQYHVMKDGQDDYGFTPLMLACRQGHHLVAQALVQAGCDVNITNEIGETALFYAAKDRTFRSTDGCAEVVISGGAEVNHKNHSGCTALHMAVQYKKVNVVKMLLHHSCSTEVKGRLSFMKNYCSVDQTLNPLEVAFLTGHFEICGLLISAGSETNVLIPHLKDSLSRNEYVPPWLTDAVSAPSDLRYLCRSQIRAYFDSRINDVIDQLPLPMQIKEFLLLPELEIS